MIAGRRAERPAAFFLKAPSPNPPAMDSSAPIPAATLVTVREPPDGPPELLMVERAEAMAFAGGALVFPGGRIDESDLALAEPFGLADGGARVAAIRETIEET